MYTSSPMDKHEVKPIDTGKAGRSIVTTTFIGLRYRYYSKLKKSTFSGVSFMWPVITAVPGKISKIDFGQTNTCSGCNY